MAKRSDPSIPKGALRKRSELEYGAHLEREQVRRFLRRQIRASNEYWATTAFQMTLDWVLERSKRYQKRPGGLGRK